MSTIMLIWLKIYTYTICIFLDPFEPIFNKIPKTSLSKKKKMHLFFFFHFMVINNPTIP